ncbi:MAG TPA: PIG-L deacetylase family protein [Acidimicrobiia bacterium]|nr:PIG-L deacetylase family protein [Acidimicrobiia bacterium]
MISLSGGFRPQRLLAIGAHSDDIEIGCGGTILDLVERFPSLSVTWVVLAAFGERRNEALDSADRFLGVLNNPVVLVESFRERYFPYLVELKEFFDELGKTTDPEVIFCPWAGDAHQDHRTVAELTHNTFRSHLILEYEIPKRDGDLGKPTIYADLSASQVERKLDLLREGFPSQTKRSWFNAEVFRSLMRLRGMELQSPSGFAEAFHCRRMKITGK